MVDTGGKSHHKAQTGLTNSEVYNDGTYSLLKLALRLEGYDWRFVPVEGQDFTDAGSAECH